MMPADGLRCHAPGFYIGVTHRRYLAFADTTSSASSTTLYQICRRQAASAADKRPGRHTAGHQETMKRDRRRAGRRQHRRQMIYVAARWHDRPRIIRPASIFMPWRDDNACPACNRATRLVGDMYLGA